MNLLVMAAVCLPLLLIGAVWYVIGRTVMRSQLFRVCLGVTLLLVTGACAVGIADTLDQYGGAMIATRLGYGTIGFMTLCGAVYSLWKHDEI